MSHVVQIELEVNDLTALGEACKSMGLELNLGQQTYKWYGTSVGDYPLPQGFKTSDLGKCEHSISVVGNPQAYEIGVVKRRDGKPGYQLIWDFWAGGCGLQAVVGDGALKLKDNYGAALFTREVKKKGMRVQRHVTTDGKIVMRAY